MRFAMAFWSQAFAGMTPRACPMFITTEVRTWDLMASTEGGKTYMDQQLHGKNLFACGGVEYICLRLRKRIYLPI